MFEPWRLRRAEVKAREEALRERLRQLSDAERRTFYRAYTPRLKDPDTYAVVNWFFLAGLHHFYLGKPINGALNMLLMLGAIALMLTGQPLGVALLLLVLGIELPALFRSEVIVADHNVRLGEDLLRGPRP
jgi:hypothetical protein